MTMKSNVNSLEKIKSQYLQCFFGGRSEARGVSLAILNINSTDYTILVRGKIWISEDDPNLESYQELQFFFFNKYFI